MKKTRDAWATLGGCVLDFKLALRMLIRYPLLTIVGGAGMAFGIAAGVFGFEVRTQLTNSRLPLDEGRSIIGLRNWDLRSNRSAPLGDADFRAWLEQLRKVEDLGAVALVDRNLTVNGSVEPVSVAEMTASGFHVARVLPLLGRTLVETDESPSAPPVAVIGHALWQRRFLGNPGIVGRSVQLGVERTTIVGVMPAEFGFPVAHQIWVPLRRGRQSAPQMRTGCWCSVGSPKVSHSTEAQAEVTTVGQRMATDTPDTHQFLRPEAMPYAHMILDPRRFGSHWRLGTSS